MRARGSWDIKTSVGSTALFVAASRGLAAREPQPLARDEFAEVFCRAAGEQWAELFTKDPAHTARHPLRTPVFGAAFQTYQTARTRWFDEFVADALAQGIRQIVILAAGLDSRAYRLPWPDGTRVFEIDQPRVLEFKDHALSDHGAEPRAERHPVPVDLRTDWPSALRQAGFDGSQPTAWLVEGLLLYMSPEEQDLLFERIDELSSPGSRAAIEQTGSFDPETFAGMTDEGTAPENHTLTPEEKQNTAEWAQLVHNEPRADAVAWFGDRGWRGHNTSLPEYLTAVGRPIRQENMPPFLQLDAVSLSAVTKNATPENTT